MRNVLRRKVQVFKKAAQTVLLGLVFFCVPAHASLSPDATTRIQSMFNQLEIAGSAYNSGGAGNAGKAMLSSGCSAFGNNALVSDSLNDALNDVLVSRFGLKSGGLGYQLGTQMGQNTLGSALSAGCAGLTGGTVNLGGDAGLASSLQDHFMLGLLNAGRQMANSSGLPFLERLELETGSERGQWVSSVTTIQPLWHDKENRNHFFTQLAWRQMDGEKTANAGLAWRHINQDKTVLYGLNTFFDHAFNMNHNRMSIGADIQTSLLGGSINKYIPLSGWKSRDTLWEERAAAGIDAEIYGQVPALPSWTASFKGYKWAGSDNQHDDPAREIKTTYGYLGQLEYAPVPALAMRGGLRHENNDETSGEFAMRLNLRFNMPLELQFKPQLELASVEDRIYGKVSRENTIRIQERRKASGLLTVTETTGANTVSGQPGILPLNVGQTVLIPATVTVANTVGAVARLRFSDGAILTIGQNSMVTIDTGLITLISGTMQYISGSTNVVINVPGGTITLLGTDIDLRSDGTLSTIRVREGSIRLTGTTASSATISAGQMAASTSGTVTTVAPGTATYIAHTDDVSSKIDRVAQPVTGMKVAPYPIEAPRLVTTATAPGQIITLGLRFNTAVTATGGTPRLAFTINGINRTASLSAGNGTNDLRFDYTLQAGDSGGSTALTITSFDNNGATITGDGKAAVTTIADATLDLGAAVGTSPTMSMNFLTNTYTLLGTTYNSLSGFLTAAAGTFTRASAGTYFDVSGALQTATAGTPRFDYDPVSHAVRGILIEEGRTNSIRNTAMTGANVGAFANNGGPGGGGGSRPTNWSNRGALASGVTAYIAGTGTEFGMNYIDLRLAGTAAGASDFGVYFEANNQIAGATGQAWTLSSYARLLNSSGSFNGIVLAIIERDSGGTGSGAGIATAFTSPSATLTRYAVTATFNGATTAYAHPGISIRHNAGALDVTVRIYAPQLERGGFATSFIPTSGAAVTRAADLLTVPTGSWYNAAQGALLAEFFSSSPAIRHVASFGDGTFANVIDLVNNSINTSGQFFVRSASSQLFLINDANNAFNAVRKSAISFAPGNYKLATNGGTVVSDTNAGFPSGISLLRIGTRSDPVEYLNGYVRNIAYYPSAISDATLQNLTAP